MPGVEETLAKEETMQDVQKKPKLMIRIRVAPLSSTDDSTSPAYSPIDSSMNSDDDEKGEKIDVTKDDDGWGTGPASGWSTTSDGWDTAPNVEENGPDDRYISTRSLKDIEEEAYKVRGALARIHVGSDTYKGPSAVGAGIFAYGPFNPPPYDDSLPLYERDYRIFIHPSSDHDVLDIFAYGGPGYKNGQTVSLLQLAVSPAVFDASQGYVREFQTLIHRVEGYICGDVRYLEGVSIPSEFLNPHWRTTHAKPS